MGGKGLRHMGISVPVFVLNIDGGVAELNCFPENAHTFRKVGHKRAVPVLCNNKLI